MFVLEDIGWATLATVIFILFHFLYERGLRLKRVVALNIKFWNIEIISGLYYSIISLAIQLIIWNFGPSFFLPISVVISIVLITIRTSVVAVINLLPSLVFFILNFNISILTYVVYIIAFIGMVTHEVSKFFIKRTWLAKIIMLSTMVIVAFVAYFIYLGTNNFLETSVYESTLILSLLSALMLAAVSYFISFSKSANILFDSVTYTYLNYYRHAVGIITIQNQIKSQELKEGMFIVLKHSYTKPLNEVDEKEIKFSFLTDIEKSVPKNTILFFIQEDIHGIFIPNSFKGNIKDSLSGNALKLRDEDDNLKGLEEFLYKSQKYYHTANGEIAGVNLKAGLSLYGIQDSSLSKLEQNALFALNAFNSRSENIISLFDPKKMKEVIEETSKLKNMDQALKLDNFENKYRGIYSLKNKKFIGAISTIINNSEFNLTSSVREHVKFNNWIDEFDRYFAIIALQEFSDAKIEKVFFNYSPLVKKTEADIKTIVSKIKQLRIDASSVHFIIDEMPKTTAQQKTISLFKQEGFKVVLENIMDEKILTKVEPDFLIISPKNFTSKIIFDRERVIFSDIKTIDDLQLAVENGAKFIAGELINEENNMKNFDIFSKQSRIYLEELL